MYCWVLCFLCAYAIPWPGLDPPRTSPQRWWRRFPQCWWPESLCAFPAPTHTINIASHVISRVTQNIEVNAQPECPPRNIVFIQREKCGKTSRKSARKIAKIRALTYFVSLPMRSVCNCTQGFARCFCKFPLWLCKVSELSRTCILYAFTSGGVLWVLNLNHAWWIWDGRALIRFQTLSI